MPTLLDKAAPAAWAAAQSVSSVVHEQVAEHGLTRGETELINVRASQLNACAFCVDLHSRQARHAGIVQQKLDLLPAWRASGLFTDRESAVLAVAEASTILPLTDDARADLLAAHRVLGTEAFVAAEWVAVAINMFNRISVLSEHPVRPRGPDDKPV
ncbi:carboxymuconolactone decarboxylase family protein [Williamsia sterculiae]|uniref:Alkylhydroperoxidase AhpD family core domain-containing protein n=1 Tax=Williamsia sterculiae TaxID=1344003 RepID=A0A1N7CDY3_9NOCA|nr:carboxymuconolactone decarboxylase family protein [Williamsia sterculiae]SIR61806.1 alkylhydroperoxidase AhpD family core domain-containing protein [Williamsia sterculiae]